MTAPVTTQTPEAYFAALQHAFDAAFQAASRQTIDLKVRAHIIRLVFAGTALIEPITRAFKHLVVPTDESRVPALTIGFWDTASTGVRAPAPPWPTTAYQTNGQVAGFNNARILMYYEVGSRILQAYDDAQAVGLYWVPDVTSIPWWELSFPFRNILHRWSFTRPFQLAHAGAVGYADGGVLITGKSGSGKSTTSLTCLNSDLLYAGDDYVLLDVADEPFVHSLYSTAKIEAHNLPRVAHVSPYVSNPHMLAEQKALIYLNEHLPEKLTGGFPIRAILVPRVTGQVDTHLKLTTGVSSLMALAPTTLMHLPSARATSFEKMSRLARGVPSYSLELGTDMAQIPRVIGDLLRSLRGNA